MRYLFTTDRVEFVELDDFIINPENAPIYRVPTMTGGILRRGRRESDRVAFTSQRLLPSGSDAIVFDSSGRIHFILVTNVSSDLSSVRYEGVLMEKPELSPEEVQQIHDLFSAYDAAGGSKAKAYRRPIPPSEGSDEPHQSP